jgi:hypothetical protein
VLLLQHGPVTPGPGPDRQGTPGGSPGPDRGPSLREDPEDKEAAGVTGAAFPWVKICRAFC